MIYLRKIFPDNENYMLWLQIVTCPFACGKWCSRRISYMLNEHIKFTHTYEIGRLPILNALKPIGTYRTPLTTHESNWMNRSDDYSVERVRTENFHRRLRKTMTIYFPLEFYGDRKRRFSHSVIITRATYQFGCILVPT